MLTRPLLPILACALLAATAHAQSPVFGNWRTVDDETGRAKSIVQISVNAEGELEGKVLEILHSDRGPDPICENCPGDKNGQPIKGLVILWDMEKKAPGEWAGGRILDPKHGKVYKAKLRLRDDGKLEVRGFIGFSLLGRTQVWEPA